MKRAMLTAITAALLTTGCATYEPASPADYIGPKATVGDQAVPISSSLVHMFEMTRIDGRKLRGSGAATAGANQGRGFAIAPVTQSNDVPTRASKVTLAAGTQYAAPILALTNPTCRVEGEVEFAPEAGRTYRVTGRIAPEQCEVWIEDLAARQPVTKKVTGKGTKS